MKKTLLGCALIGALGLAQVATAQDFDDRWYLSGTAGFIQNDSDRKVDDSPIYALGVGKFFTRNFSLDLDLTSSNPTKDGNDLHWSSYGAMLTARSHFRGADRNWWPYVAYGAPRRILPEPERRPADQAQGQQPGRAGRRRPAGGLQPHRHAHRAAGPLRRGRPERECAA